ncbi:hypothetical protein N7492_006816 [Penicillium capsulatum]|uniref:Uncharacterized protein n=1 Tax=Penicillium capsulatum TaxID=69766 RepID=A0A9W9I021_9EURO|nr:hypothetical protein N7492_006816 [Penicillium capsulatum]KAJ6116651.1 hypothetical protein N7512_006376 [Penicillium capsulatum]
MDYRATQQRRLPSASVLVQLTRKYYIDSFLELYNTYDHRVWKTGLPVRSAVLKPHAGELVVRWVTTSESSLLYVFCFYFVFRFFL